MVEESVQVKTIKSSKVLREAISCGAFSSIFRFQRVTGSIELHVHI